MLGSILAIGFGSLLLGNPPRRRRKARRRRRNPETEARELVLFITNDGTLYRQQAQPIIANLRKKIASGKYDATKALKLWGYLANSGAQKYTKEFGGSGNGSYGSFSAADRRLAAKELAESYEEELRSATNPRVAKTHIEFIIQGNYGNHGWEDENTELTVQDARRSLREYRENGPGSYRLIRRRVKNDATNPRRRRSRRRY